MLYTVAVILLIAWLLGIVGTYTIGAYVHVLFAVAVPRWAGERPFARWPSGVESARQGRRDAAPIASEQFRGHAPSIFCTPS
jgi:Family of unknown function (DUF5670)